MTKQEMLDLANILADECSALSTDPNLLRIILSRAERNEVVSALRTAAQPQTPSDPTIDLMQRVWLNLYYDEEDAGNTFQQTLNEVVDWLSDRNALPEAAHLPGCQSGDFGPCDCSHSRPNHNS